MKDSLRLYFKMLGFLRPYAGHFFISLIMSVLIVVFNAASIWVAVSLLNMLFIPESAAMARPEFTIANVNEILKWYTYSLVRAASPVRSLQIVCALMVAAYTLKNVFSYINSLLVHAINLRVIRNLRDRLFDHVVKLPVSYFDRHKSGNIVSLAVNDINAINQAMANTLSKLLTEPLTLITNIALLLAISPSMTAMVFLIYPVLAFLIVKIGQAVRRRSKRVLVNFSGLLSVLHETLGGIRAVKMFTMNQHESQKFMTENDKFSRSQFRSLRMSTLSSPLTETLGVLVAAALLLYGGGRVLAGSSAFAAEDFVRFLALLVFSYEPFKRLSKINNTLQGGMAAAERVFGLLGTEPEPLGTAKTRVVPAFEQNIVFENVRFTYPGADEEVLHGVGFEVKKGTVAALVGSSGSGKSTILDLLPRFYEVSSGRILIDGCDTRHMDLVGLRQLFGIVSQDTILFNDTVANNIRYGAPAADQEQIREAVRAAYALEFIEALPRGMDTVIGEKGVMLSGGQRQRLAIARALLCNPPILILDEATSALDTESEKAVQKAIGRLMKNRTALIVAHRLSTIQHADTILVLDKGVIIEQGRHENLIESGGRYKYFYDIQVAGSRG